MKCILDFEEFLGVTDCFLLLLPIVSALKTNKALHQLHLTNNLLNSYQDALQLGDLLRYNNTLQTLDLSCNAIADAGKMTIFCAKIQFCSLMVVFN